MELSAFMISQITIYALHLYHRHFNENCVFLMILGVHFYDNGFAKF